MASTVNVRQKSSTFRCEWISSTYNTKSEDFSLEPNRDEVDDDGLREKNCCVGVKHVPRLGSAFKNINEKTNQAPFTFSLDATSSTL